MSPAEIEELREPISQCSQTAGGLISGLRHIQERYGHIPEPVIGLFADIFNISRAEVLGVVSFYRDFSRQPMTDTVIRLCAAEACQAAGGRELKRDLEALMDDPKRFAEASGNMSLGTVFCLGLCSVGPAAMVGDELLGRADAQRIYACLSQQKKIG